MTLRIDWIPTRNDDIYNKLKSYMELIVANKVAWGIPDTAIDPVLDLQTEFDPLYDKIQDKRRRTSADVTAFNDCKKRLLVEWRAFHMENVRKNRRIPKSDLSILVGKEFDLEPTPRGKINDVPYVKLTAMGGGDVRVRATVEEDQTKSSMHPLADAVECRYILVPKGEMPPEGQKNAKTTIISKKALFIISCGDEQAGETFWGFFRWANQSNPANSGQWSHSIKVVIA